MKMPFNFTQLITFIAVFLIFSAFIIGGSAFSERLQVFFANPAIAPLLSGIGVLFAGYFINGQYTEIKKSLEKLNEEKSKEIKSSIRNSERRLQKEAIKAESKIAEFVTENPWLEDFDPLDTLHGVKSADATFYRVLELLSEGKAQGAQVWLNGLVKENSDNDNEPLLEGSATSFVNVSELCATALGDLGLGVRFLDYYAHNHDIGVLKTVKSRNKITKIPVLYSEQKGILKTVNKFIFLYELRKKSVSYPIISAQYLLLFNRARDYANARNIAIKLNQMLEAESILRQGSIQAKILGPLFSSKYKALSEAVRFGSDWRVIVALAEYYSALQDFKKAESLISRGVNRTKDSVQHSFLHRAYAKINYAKDGNVSKYESSLRNLISEFPFNLFIYKDLCDLLVREGRRKDASFIADQGLEFGAIDYEQTISFMWLSVFSRNSQGHKLNVNSESFKPNILLFRDRN